MRPSSATSRSSAGSRRASEASEELPQPLERSRVPRFLETYGFIARDHVEWWESPLPELTLQVKGHEKVGKQTYYQVDCSLAKPGQWQSPYLTWRSSLRLTQLRAGLHDQVKRELGDAYKSTFDGVHFAHRYAVNGTTARLDAWCRRLANAITTKTVTPVVAASTLQLLGVPDGSAMEASGSPSGSPGASPGKEIQPADMASRACIGRSAQLPASCRGPAGVEDLNPFSEDLLEEEAPQISDLPAGIPRFSGSPACAGADPGSPLGRRSDGTASGA